MTNTEAALTYRGVEITAANHSHALRHIAADPEHGPYSDLYLQVDATFGHGGYARAARYLLDAPAEHRQAITGEAHIIENTAGLRYADAVWDVVRSVKRGDLRFPATAANLRMLAHEREAREIRFKTAAAALRTA